MIRPNMRRHLKQLRWSLAIIPVFLTFQNCGGGFSAIDAALNTSIFSNGIVAERMTCSAGSRGLADKTSRRLTRAELKASLTQVFGAATVAKTQVSAALGNFTDETSHTYGRRFDPAIPSTYVDGVMATAEAVAEVMATDSAALAVALPGCNVGGNLQGCVDTMLGDLALRILRRPIPAETKTEITNLIASSAGIEKLQLGIMRLLISPYFYQQIETGDSVVGMRLKMNQYEIASRLSFRLIGAAPDLQLLRAAANNELQTQEQIQTQARRLMATPRAVEHVREFFTTWLGLEKVPDPDPLIMNLRGIASSGLGSEAREELLKFVEYTVFTKKGDFRELLTSPVIFPYTDRLANLYGAAKSSNPTASTGGHGGLVLRMAILMNNGMHSNPIVRGVTLREKMLCQEFKPPDPAAVAARQNEVAAITHTKYSNREFVHAMTNVPACMSCHSMINPIGFALEGYDGFGMKRSTELVYDSAAKVIAQHPVVTSVEDVKISSAVVPVQDADSLLSAMAESDRAKACMAQRMIEYTHQRAPASEDGCAVNESMDVLTAKGSIIDFMITTAAGEDIFWKSAN